MIIDSVSRFPSLTALRVGYFNCAPLQTGNMINSIIVWSQCPRARSDANCLDMDNLTPLSHADEASHRSVITSPNTSIMCSTPVPNTDPMQLNENHQTEYRAKRFTDEPNLSF